MRMRLMLLGGGNALSQALIRLGSEEDIHFLAPRPPDHGWDVSSLTQTLDENVPDILVNLAYYHDWFQASSVDLNRLAHQEHMVKWLAVLCQQRGVILIQPSSYRVFDGLRTMPYAETDSVAPLDARGHLFVVAEQAIRALCPKHVLLRFGWLLDSTPEGNVGLLLTALRGLDPIYLADDRRGNPTPLEDAARVLLAVLKQLDCNAPLWGTYHYGGHEAVSQMGLGQALADAFSSTQGTRSKHLVSRPHAECWDTSVEPQHAVLACKKISHAFGIKSRSWRSAVPELLDNYYRYV